MLVNVGAEVLHLLLVALLLLVVRENLDLGGLISIGVEKEHVVADEARGAVDHGDGVLLLQ